MYTDTIAAVATALSNSGIGIVRVSGSDAISIVHPLFYNKFGKNILLSAKSHTIHYGFFVDGFHYEKIKNNDCFDINPVEEEWKKHVIDEVMVSVMRSPNSYTREDTVEINCHGGILVVKKILETIIHFGARMADPGEFTKRAFLNGRIDLSKAEAVMDVIHSQNELALKSSVQQLRGDLYNEIKSLRKSILYEIAFIESALDDPEHISLDGYAEKLSITLGNLTARLMKLANSFDNGRRIKDGISTVILGKPNAGKSSLLNILVGEDRAIVTDIAGTTRDILQEQINFHGISLNIIDTAGIRDTKDKVEQIGVDRAKKFAKDADLILYVVDSSVALDDSDRDIISLIKNKNTVVLLNKSDKENIVGFDDIENLIKNTIGSSLFLHSSDYSRHTYLVLENSSLMQKDKEQIKKTLVMNEHKIVMLKTSTKDITDNSGMDEFENVMKDLFFSGDLRENNEIIITNTRHKEALDHSLESLNLVRKSIDDGMEEDFFSIDLMNAYSELGKIIGEEVEDDLVEEIFSKFCMGK